MYGFYEKLNVCACVFNQYSFFFLRNYVFYCAFPLRRARLSTASRRVKILYIIVYRAINFYSRKPELFYLRREIYVYFFFFLVFCSIRINYFLIRSRKRCPRTGNPVDYLARIHSRPHAVLHKYHQELRLSNDRFIGNRQISDHFVSLLESIIGYDESLPYFIMYRFTRLTARLTIRILWRRRPNARHFLFLRPVTGNRRT